MILPIESRIDLVEINTFPVHVLRDDLIHPLISGNKWRKLKGFVQDRKEGIISSGGPYSNHLLACAAYAQMHKLESIGYVRGNYHRFESATMHKCKSLGMQLRYLSNADFKQLLETPSKIMSKSEIERHTYIPFGGDGAEAELGIQEMASQINLSCNPDLVFVPAGTGATAYYLAKHLNPHIKLFVFPAVNNPPEIKALAKRLAILKRQRVTELMPASTSPLGKLGDEEKACILEWNAIHEVKWDPVYNGKLFYALQEKAVQYLARDQKALVIHTGGLFGWHS